MTIEISKDAIDVVNKTLRNPQYSGDPVSVNQSHVANLLLAQLIIEIRELKSRIENINKASLDDKATW